MGVLRVEELGSLCTYFYSCDWELKIWNFVARTGGVGEEVVVVKRVLRDVFAVDPKDPRQLCKTKLDRMRP